MSLEIWTKWEPIKNLPKTLILKSLSDDENGIRLKLISEENRKTINIKFIGNIMSYRNTDEGKLLKLMNDLADHYGDDFFGSWCFFKVEKSDYLKWFHDQTYDMYKNFNIQHFVIKTSEDIVELLAACEPKVTMINN